MSDSKDQKSKPEVEAPKVESPKVVEDSRWPAAGSPCALIPPYDKAQEKKLNGPGSANAKAKEEADKKLAESHKASSVK